MEQTYPNTVLRAASWPILWLGRFIMGYVNSITSFAHFIKEVVRWTFRRPFRVHLIFQQLEFVGNQSLPIIAVSSLAVGAVFGLLVGGVFQVFKAENLLGGVTAKALCMEMAPITTLILLAGRAGSAMCAEIAIMKVNEQVDALEAMAVDPVSYLVVPRLLASVVIGPLLNAVFVYIGIIGAYLVGVSFFHIDQGMFVEKITRIVEAKDLWRGLFKMTIFSGIMALVCCKFGLQASGGAKGVGKATTTAVVTTLLTVLGVDVVITYFQIIW